MFLLSVICPGSAVQGAWKEAAENVGAFPGNLSHPPGLPRALGCARLSQVAQLQDVTLSQVGENLVLSLKSFNFLTLQK